jgi:hypothetical protein
MTGRTAMTATYSELPNNLVSAANGTDYAYRETGEGSAPLVLLQHFRDYERLAAFAERGAPGRRSSRTPAQPPRMAFSFTGDPTWRP